MRHLLWILGALALSSASPLDPARTDEPELGGDDEDENRAPPELLPRVPLARAAGWILAPEPSPAAREESAEAALERYLDDQITDDRIESGDVDGWYYESSREIRRRFRPDPVRFESQRTAGMTTLQRLYDGLRQQALPLERPIDVPGQTPPELRASVARPGDVGEVQAQERLDRCNPLNAAVTWHGVVLRVTHGPEGELMAVWVERSSGSRELDRSALRAVREGSVDLGPPPPNVVGERQAIRADWLFELGIVTLRAECGGGCIEDPDLGMLCGDRMHRRRMRLLGVVDAGHLTPEERRAERRADPERARP